MRLNRRDLLLLGASAGASSWVGCTYFAGIAHAQSHKMVFHAGSIGGTYFIVGAAFTAAWQEQIPGMSASVVPGGGLTNIISVSRATNGNEVGISNGSLLLQSKSGTGEFEKQGFGALSNIRALVNLGYGSVQHLTLLRSSNPGGVRTLGELLEKKPKLSISVGPRGTGGELGVRAILELYGVSYDTFESWGGSIQYSDINDAVGGMRDGLLDGVWQDFPFHSPGLTELSLSRDIDILSISPDVVKKYTEQVGASPITIPAGTYKGVDYPVETIFDAYILIANEALNPALAEEMTRIVLVNKPRWVSAFRGLSVFDPANAWQTPVPLHEGAAAAMAALGYRH